MQAANKILAPTRFVGMNQPRSQNIGFWFRNLGSGSKEKKISLLHCSYLFQKEKLPYANIQLCNAVPHCLILIRGMTLLKHNAFSGDANSYLASSLIKFAMRLLSSGHKSFKEALFIPPSLATWKFKVTFQKVLLKWESVFHKIIQAFEDLIIRTWK